MLGLVWILILNRWGRELWVRWFRFWFVIGRIVLFSFLWVSWFCSSLWSFYYFILIVSLRVMFYRVVSIWFKFLLFYFSRYCFLILCDWVLWRFLFEECFCMCYKRLYVWFLGFEISTDDRSFLMFKFNFMDVFLI